MFNKSLRKRISWFRKISDKLLSRKVVLRGHGLPGAKLTQEKAKLLEYIKQEFRSVERRMRG